MNGYGLKISLLGYLMAVAAVMLGQQPLVRITLHFDDTPLQDVMDQIEQQSGLSFSYHSRLVDEDERVTIHLDEMPLDEVLDIIFSGRRIDFEVVEKQIVLKRARRVNVRVEASVLSDSISRVPVKFTVSGFVRDAATGEVLIGATITIPGGAEGTITNNYGFFSITLKRNVKELLCSYIGYRNMSIPLQAPENQTVHFTLEKELEPIAEVTVYSNEGDNLIRTTRSSEERILPESVRKMPALLGEKDVIKSLAAIPGIKFFGDGSTIFFVRGGGRDQNLITIDEAPVYNPTHLLGYFSAIVPDAVKEVTIYKGDFPANYGGRLSSLIDIRTKDGNMNKFGLDGSIGLLSSKLSLEGPIWKEHISFFASGRRSHITRPVQNWTFFRSAPEVELSH